MIFIRSNDTLPSVISDGFGTGQDIVFTDNTLSTGDNDLAAVLVARGYELVADDDPRRDFILAEGWSRQAQRRYAVEAA